MELAIKNYCKICKSSKIRQFAHSAKCLNCKVLLYYPYPSESELKNAPANDYYSWYNLSFDKNIINFIEMIKFTVNRSNYSKKIKVLDYGGGSGQFALIFKSLFPSAEVFIVDIDDTGLFSQFKSLNNQILFKNFSLDKNKFDYIFLNDVYEHVDDPIKVLKTLKAKLNSEGLIFIDTPKHFWIYPFFQFFSKKIYLKLLQGTVSLSHLQIWSLKSFEISVKKAGMKIDKIKLLSEFTMTPDYYLSNMKFKNKFVINFFTFIFFVIKKTFKNKIFSTLKK